MVASAEPFQLAAEAPTKFVPVSVSVVVAPPTVVDDGLIDASVGDGFVTIKIWPAEVPPPGERFVTVTVDVPAEAI